MDKFNAMVQAKLAEGPEGIPYWVYTGTYVIMMLFVYSQISVRDASPGRFHDPR